MGISSGSEQYLLALKRDGKSVFSFNSALLSTAASAPLTEDELGSLDYIASGSNDAFLNDLKNLAEKDDVLLPGLRFNAAMHYGGGVEYGKLKVDPDTKEKYLEPFYSPEIEDFLERNKFHLQLMTGLLDMGTYAFAIWQFGFTKDKKKIARLTTQFTRPVWCRLARRNTFGNIPKVFLNADFGTTKYKKDKNITLLNAPEYIDDAWLKDTAAKKNEFTMVCQVPDLGRSYYTSPDWYSVVKSGWYDIGKLIAESKKFMFQNQFSIKYHIKIHPDFWSMKVGQKAWNTKTEEEKNVLKNEILDNLTEFLQGTEKTGSTFFSELKPDGRGGVATEMIQIVPIANDFMKDGQFMKEGNESSDRILSGLGIHPELIGNAPGSKMGAGSGSAARVAFNQRVSLSLFMQQQALDPLRVVRDYNGWGDDVRFMIRNSLITTLDTGASATAPKTQV